MWSFKLLPFGESESLTIREALLDCVESRTRGRVRDLDVDCLGDLVVVTGGCETLAVKQLVTRTIRSAEPLVRVQNEIRVCA